jgi:hypothetical protein
MISLIEDTLNTAIKNNSHEINMSVDALRTILKQLKRNAPKDAQDSLFNSFKNSTPKGYILLYILHIYSLI